MNLKKLSGKLLLLILALIFALSLSACGNNGANNDEEDFAPLPAAAEKGTLYKNELDKFQLRYNEKTWSPLDEAMVSDDPDAIAAFKSRSPLDTEEISKQLQSLSVMFAGGSQNSEASINVRIEQGVGGDMESLANAETMSALEQHLLQVYIRVGNNPKTSSQTKIQKFGDNEFLIIQIDSTSADDTVSRIYQAISIIGGVSPVITLTCPADSFSGYSSDIELMLSSFKLN